MIYCAFTHICFFCYSWLFYWLVCFYFLSVIYFFLFCYCRGFLFVYLLLFSILSKLFGCLLNYFLFYFFYFLHSFVLFIQFYFIFYFLIYWFWYWYWFFQLFIYFYFLLLSNYYFLLRVVTKLSSFVCVHVISLSILAVNRLRIPIVEEGRMLAFSHKGKRWEGEWFLWLLNFNLVYVKFDQLKDLRICLEGRIFKLCTAVLPKYIIILFKYKKHILLSTFRYVVFIKIFLYQNKRIYIYKTIKRDNLINWNCRASVSKKSVQTNSN